MKRILVLSIIPLLLIQMSLLAQNEKIRLAGRHTLFMESGFKSNSTTSVVVNSSTVETKAGFIGGINYGYWFDEQWGLTLSVGLFGAETSTKFNGVETSAIIPVLFGIRFYPESFSLGSIGRPYAGLSLGQYMGFATKVKSVFNTETVNEPAFGGEASVGVDLFVASWFKIGPKFSYHFLGDFSEVIGTKKNLSGASFSVEFGFVL
jgi:hypothetical protein